MLAKAPSLGHFNGEYQEGLVSKCTSDAQIFSELGHVLLMPYLI